MEIKTYDEACLREKSQRVENINQEIVELVNNMISLLSTKNGIGLAAPQVGINLRLFIVEIDKGKPQVFINPEITSTSHELSKYEEGCLSIPGVWAPVKRPQAISMQAINLDGKIFRIESDDILARVVQHEYDHLEGILFVDHIIEKKREKLLNSYFKNRKK